MYFHVDAMFVNNKEQEKSNKILRRHICLISLMLNLEQTKSKLVETEAFFMSLNNLSPRL